jgi:arginine N-succinyltransferase
MVDADNGKVVGAAGIVTKVGGYEPFYAYRIEKLSLRCDSLKVRKEIPMLHLVREHDGPAEIGSLFLAPDYRRTNNGRFLQLVRFLFLAMHRDAFEQTVVSELRGVIDEHGRSAFWDAIGRHFFPIEFPEADYLSVVNKKFIADLMPSHPLYIPLLPEAAQKVIGLVHEQSKPALKNLQAEGFSFNGMIDIFDGGACISCARDDIRTVRECRSEPVREVVEEIAGTPLYMLATCGAAFRACMGHADVSGGNGLRITRASARLIGAEPGQMVCFSPLRPATPPPSAEAKP